jgi:hypothetical protein
MYSLLIIAKEEALRQHQLREEARLQTQTASVTDKQSLSLFHISHVTKSGTLTRARAPPTSSQRESHKEYEDATRHLFERPHAPPTLKHDFFYE